MVNSNPQSTDRREEIIRRFLRYSFFDVHFEYDALTPEERSFCSKQEFEQLARWVLNQGGSR